MKVVMDTMDSLKNIISDIKYFLQGGINTLPLSIAGTMLLLGLFTSNYAMLFFLLGFLLLIPFATWSLNHMVSLMDTNRFTVSAKEICSVSSPFETVAATETVVISEWSAMTLFFFGYMIQNAISLLNKEPEGDVEVDDSKIATRKTQALMALFAMILVLLFVVYYRLKTGCEPYHDPITIAVGVFVAAAAFGAGIGWYHMLGIVGQDRLSDLFGIANRLLAPGAMKNGPVACVPVP